MPENRTKVAVLYGGVSAEREVSKTSAENVLACLEETPLSVLPVEILADGSWQNVVSDADPSPIQDLITNLRANADVVFSLLHGPFGEDGSMQGFMDVLGMPYVGPRVLSSALGMDKISSKAVAKANDILTSRFVSLNRNSVDMEAIRALGFPLFVKPSNAGSSIGITRVEVEGDLEEAIDLAFEYDNRVIVEQFIDGREIEFAIRGYDPVEVTAPAEIIVDRPFYDYIAKYSDAKTRVQIPADLPPEAVEEGKEFVRRICEVLNVEGMARVDTFYSESKWYFNEINTLPGFTKTSVYPMLWEAEGLKMPKLIEALVEEAIQRRSRTKTALLSKK